MDIEALLLDHHEVMRQEQNSGGAGSSEACAISMAIRVPYPQPARWTGPPRPRRRCG